MTCAETLMMMVWVLGRLGDKGHRDVWRASFRMCFFAQRQVIRYLPLHWANWYRLNGRTIPKVSGRFMLHHRSLPAWNNVRVPVTTSTGCPLDVVLNLRPAGEGGRICPLPFFFDSY